MKRHPELGESLFASTMRLGMNCRIIASVAVGADYASHALPAYGP